MLTSERKAYIRDVLRRDGRIVAKALSEELRLSQDTVRRDLRELAREGVLQRVHGGALPASPAVVDYQRRGKIATEAKVRLGRAAARLVEPGQVVFIDGGTTNVQLARALAPTVSATVVTHSPSIAVELANHPLIEVELVGGRLFKHSVVALGATAIDAIRRVRPDIFFMGVTGVHPEAGLTTGDSEEAAIKRAISVQSGETVVLATAEKLGAASAFMIAPLQEATSLIVEAAVPETVLAALRAAGMSISTA
jgi:DeoR/GlpR family transcriptional regulator of sugar metabolism